MNLKSHIHVVFHLIFLTLFLPFGFELPFFPESLQEIVPCMLASSHFLFSGFRKQFYHLKGYFVPAIPVYV
jgi:hypothetical protein